MSLSITKLPKKNKSRLLDQDTYKIVCEDPETHIKAIQTFKSGKETGSDVSEFTHVALGILKKFKKQCVIKVHYTKSYFTKKEIEISEKLEDCPYALKHICTYTCIDSKERWMETLKKPQKTCKDKGGNDDLTFMIMPYIQDGDVCDFINKASKEEIVTLFLVTAVAITEIAKYNVSHGDLNSGNILITHRKPALKTIKVGNAKYTFNTYGIHPLFIDFGRGHVYHSKIAQSHIIDDILTMFSVLVNYVPLQSLKEELNNIIMSISKHSNPRLSQVFKQLLDISHH